MKLANWGMVALSAIPVYIIYRIIELLPFTNSFLTAIVIGIIFVAGHSIGLHEAMTQKGREKSVLSNAAWIWRDEAKWNLFGWLKIFPTFYKFNSWSGRLLPAIATYFLILDVGFGIRFFLLGLFYTGLLIAIMNWSIEITWLKQEYWDKEF